MGSKSCTGQVQANQIDRFGLGGYRAKGNTHEKGQALEESLRKMNGRAHNHHTALLVMG